ncbi:hypothetical protein AHAS_Ahas17G0255700 [Arachis hypogaea]
MASPSTFFLFLLFILLTFHANAESIILEEGFTVTTVLDGHKINVNPHSILQRSGSSDLILLDSTNSVFYTLQFPISSDSIVRRLSGDGSAGYKDGDVISAEFNKPRSFAVDLKGNVYVADKNNKAIRKISSNAMKGARLKDLPTFLRTTNPSDVMFNYNIVKVNTAMHAKGIILNTFEDLESEVLDAIRAKYSNVYSIGPLSMLFKQLSNSNTQLELIDLNLWKEDNKCLEWLDKRDRGSVVYVNFGSLVIMIPKQLSEFAWGLVNSKYHFLCERGLVLGWCQQEKVLCHASIGGFLTHCGWNSTLESICEGVPMACWPFFAEQQTNSFCACKKWGIGIEIECDVKREQVEGLVRELMEGQKGKEIKVYKLEGLI